MPTGAPGVKNPRKGFGSMSAERRAAIARKGGVVVQASGLGHQWTPDEARAAGRKGGLATAQAKRERA